MTAALLLFAPKFVLAAFSALTFACADWLKTTQAKRLAAFVRFAAWTTLGLAIAIALTAEFPFLEGLWVDRPLTFLLMLIATYVLAAAIGKTYRPAARNAALAFCLVSPPCLVSWFDDVMHKSDRCDIVLDDPRISALFSLCDNERIEQPRSMFASSDPRFMYLTSGLDDADDTHAILKVERASGVVTWSTVGYMSTSGFCRADAQCFISYSPDSSVRQLDETHQKFVAQAHAPRPHGKLRFLAYDAVSHTIFAGTGKGPAGIVKFDAAPLKYAGSLRDRGLPPSGRRDFENFELKLSDDGRSLLFVESGFGQTIHSFDFELNRIRSYTVPWHARRRLLGRVLAVADDARRNILYASSVADGAVHVFGRDTGRYDGKIAIGVGARTLAIDVVKNRLFVAGYIDGFVHIVDLDTRRVVDRIFVGKRTRDIFYDPQRDSVLVASANGWFEIDVSGVALAAALP